MTGRAVHAATAAATAAAASAPRGASESPAIGALFYVGVSRRMALAVVLLVVAAVAIARSVVFMLPGVRFDADQAVVGLMAKHISEGRAFPVFFYGQSYLLALEAYLAAPLMWLLGPTEVALKLPALAVNLTAILLLVWLASRDLGLRPWLAAVCVLPLTLPPLVPTSRLIDAGGHGWPLGYARRPLGDPAATVGVRLRSSPWPWPTAS